MKVPVIRNLVKTYSADQLREAEAALLEEQPLAIEVGGDDEGEQLTHIIGALEIHDNISKGMSEGEALRAFTTRVRNSIS